MSRNKWDTEKKKKFHVKYKLSIVVSFFFFPLDNYWTVEIITSVISAIFGRLGFLSSSWSPLKSQSFG